MTREEFESLSEEEQKTEFERCKDPVYIYNNYWLVNGKKPKPITKEEYDELIKSSTERRYKRRSYHQPIKINIPDYLIEDYRVTNL